MNLPTVTVHPGGNYIDGVWLERCGPFVLAHEDGAVYTATPNTQTAPGSIPVGYRPTHTIASTGFYLNNYIMMGYFGRQLFTNGDIQTSSSGISGNQEYHWSVLYLTNDAWPS